MNTRHGRRQWQKLAQTTRLASFGPLISFYFSILSFVLIITVKLGSIDVSKRRVGSGKSAATKTSLFPPPLTINDILYICLGSNNPPDAAELFVKREFY